MHEVELNSVRGSEFCETLTGGFTREFPGGRTPRRVKLQRSGTPRAVEFPEEWNSQGVELAAGWNSRAVWNSVELNQSGTHKCEIRLTGKFGDSKNQQFEHHRNSGPGCRGPEIEPESSKRRSEKMYAFQFFYQVWKECGRSVEGCWRWFQICGRWFQIKNHWKIKNHCKKC